MVTSKQTLNCDPGLITFCCRHMYVVRCDGCFYLIVKYVIQSKWYFQYWFHIYFILKRHHNGIESIPLWCRFLYYRSSYLVDAQTVWPIWLDTSINGVYWLWLKICFCAQKRCFPLCRKHISEADLRLLWTNRRTDRPTDRQTGRGCCCCSCNPSPTRSSFCARRAAGSYLCALPSCLPRHWSAVRRHVAASSTNPPIFFLPPADLENRRAVGRPAAAALTRRGRTELSSARVSPMENASRIDRSVVFICIYCGKLEK